MPFRVGRYVRLDGRNRKVGRRACSGRVGRAARDIPWTEAMFRRQASGPRGEFFIPTPNTLLPKCSITPALASVCVRVMKRARKRTKNAPSARRKTHFHRDPAAKMASREIVALIAPSVNYNGNAKNSKIDLTWPNARASFAEVFPGKSTFSSPSL